jgi:hypothetical protein
MARRVREPGVTSIVNAASRRRTDAARPARFARAPHGTPVETPASMRAASSIALVLVLAGSIRSSSARAEPAPEPKDPATAEWMSGVPALLGGLLIAEGLRSRDDSGAGAALIGGAVLTIGPSAGHWYAGETFTAGMGLRLVGDALIFYGAQRDISCNCDNSGGPIALGGLALLMFGAGYDVATAGGAVDTWNHAHASHVTVMPTAIPTTGGPAPGMMLTGSF